MLGKHSMSVLCCKSSHCRRMLIVGEGHTSSTSRIDEAEIAAVVHAGHAAVHVPYRSDNKPAPRSQAGDMTGSYHEKHRLAA